MLLPSPEATEELPMNPFRAVRSPPRLPQHFQQDPFHEGGVHTVVQYRASLQYVNAMCDPCAACP